MDLLFKTYCKLEKKVGQNSWGLFAQEFIPKDKIIFSFGGAFLLKNERYNSNVVRSTCIGVNDNIILCATTSSGKDISDYINHSCEPNVGLNDAITVIAVKNIQKGEELCIDYRFWEFRLDWELDRECNCGALSCSKLIKGSFYKEIDEKYPYFRYFSPALKNKIIKNK